MRWHVSTAEGWITVEAEEKPEGNLVHEAEPSCLKWECGWKDMTQVTS